MVEKNEPKLAPLMPIRCASISERAASQSQQALPAACHAGIEKNTPRSGASYCPGPSMASTARPRSSHRSPYRDTPISLKLSMPGTEITTGILPPA